MSKKVCWFPLSYLLIPMIYLPFSMSILLPFFSDFSCFWYPKHDTPVSSLTMKKVHFLCIFVVVYKSQWEWPPGRIPFLFKTCRYHVLLVGGNKIIFLVGHIAGGLKSLGLPIISPSKNGWFDCFLKFCKSGPISKGFLSQKWLILHFLCAIVVK